MPGAAWIQWHSNTGHVYFVYRMDSTVNTELSLLNFQTCVSDEWHTQYQALQPYRNMRAQNHSSGAYYIMLVPLRGAEFPNLLVGELYQCEGHRGTGIDTVILALPATCKVWMFYWDWMRIGCHDSKPSRRGISMSALRHIRYFKLHVHVFIITIFILIICTIW
jgi:hypothetical protein